MNASFNWYILHTKDNSEPKLVHFLSRKGHRCFFPQYQETEKRHLREKSSPKSLFTSWVFVYCTMKELTTITQQVCSVKIVYRINNPAIVKEEEMASIRYVVDHFKKVEAVKTPIGTTFCSTPATEGIVYFSLPSLGFVLLASQKIGFEQENRHSMERINVMSNNPMKQEKNGLSLLKRLPSFRMRQLLKPSSL